MLLKRAVEGDYEEIVDLINLAFRGTGDEASWNSEADFIEGQRLNESLLREDLAKKSDAQLLTYREEADGVLLGTVWLEPKENGVWYLGLLTVRPDLQKRQTGRAGYTQQADRTDRGRAGVYCLFPSPSRSGMAPLCANRASRC